ncbi:hypothetical protein [Corallococcus llansteffanensis]|uniref:Outer membrane protein beta-barrel domain-containing protein n=1 Tax=Corallococcus llansteffanensis TaxID=2316731 RepID=A0A3A8NKK2_9BACT|nr:hypothetical protein [Corallococcus llansteffanensis]RKH39964.1 hypothetical protein D7V93_39920 [Corallococcus llansteffanensis]
MNKAMLIPVLLLLTATRAQAQAMEALGLRASVGEKPGQVLWIAPVVHGSFMLMGPPMAGMLHLALPVGTNLKLSDRTDLVIEVTPRFTRRRCTDDFDSCGTVRALTVSTGLAWTPWPRARGDGFFLQPKLSGMVSNEKDRPDADEGQPANRSTTGGQLTLGLDLGYRKTTARSNFYLAAVFGAGVGYSWNQRRKELDLGAQYTVPWGEERRNGRIVDINMDILRLGFGF